jgi:transcription elongation factor Elf1
MIKSTHFMITENQFTCPKCKHEYTETSEDATSVTRTLFITETTCPLCGNNREVNMINIFEAQLN